MAIRIENEIAITDEKRGRFVATNFSNYTQEQLSNLEVKGTQVGDIVYNSTIADLNFWDGEKWVPQPNGRGEEVFTTPGRSNWICPQGVTSVCVVCVGGGGGGGINKGELGGFGGGLGWKNNIPVKAGQAYVVMVGNGGLPGSDMGNGGDSYFISDKTVMGAGGLGGQNRKNNQSYQELFLPGGRYVGDGGGIGGGFNNYWKFSHGGAGAGGYTGSGGSVNYNMPGDNGQGGGGGAGTNGRYSGGGDNGPPGESPGNPICISVVDECINVPASRISDDWDSFRRNYPDREFWLLQPEGTLEWPEGDDPASLKIPSAYYSDSKANPPQPVKRDYRNPFNTSDWFNMCNLSEVPKGTIISLAIDDSGSTEYGEVGESIDLFREKCEKARLEVVEEVFKSERWSYVHNKPLIPTNFTRNSPETQGNGGGGVGIYGQGANGLGGGRGNGKAGSGGSSAHGTGTDGQSNRNRPNGGFPGGGGGADHEGALPGKGGGGVVRILWGKGRAFPSTDVDRTE